MYKKIGSYLVFSLFAPLVALGADDPSRARLYIPVATNTTIDGCTTCEVKASGYAAGYVFGFGLGLGVSSSKLSISYGSSLLDDYSVDTGPMIDIGYTFGSDFTFTLGYGVGSSASSDQKGPDSTYKVEGKGSSNSFLGLGYNFGSIEILLGLRSVNATLNQSYTDPYFGPVSYVAKYTWSSTDIGIGFTF